MLWSQVLMASDTKDWLRLDTPDVTSHGVEVLETIWTVVYSHIILRDTVLRKQKRRLRLLKSCLKALLQMLPPSHLSLLMAARFLTLHLFLQRGLVSKAQVILTMQPEFRWFRS